MKNLIIILALVFCFAELSAQSLDILGINAAKYPTISMEFRVKDNTNKEVRSFNKSDFTLQDDNCKNISDFLIDCQGGGTCKLSFIFVVDKSPTMFENFPGKTELKYMVVKKIFKMLMQKLPRGNYEAAVVSFWGQVKIQQDFTVDSLSLVRALDTVYRFPLAQTNFNAGLLYDCNGNSGALELAKKAKYKPVIILLTDGLQNYSNTRCNPSQNNVLVGQIIAAAAALPIPATIGTITFGTEQSAELCQIARATPMGDCILSTDEGEIDGWLSSIIANLCTIAPPPPCTISWEACCDGGNVTLGYTPFAKTAQTTYSVDNSVKPFLVVNSNDPYFFNIEPGKTKDIIVSVTARQNFVRFDAQNPYTISDPRFTILSSPDLKNLTINKDETKQLTVRYTSNDSGYHKADIVFNSTACNGNNWNATAGWIYSKNVHVGAGVLSQPRDTIMTDVFCNLSGKPLTINNIYPNQGDAGDFQIIEPQLPLVVQSGDCIEIKVRFTPSGEGLRKTTLVIETSDGTYRSDLTGDGSGYPNIKVGPANDIAYPNSNCKEYTHDTTIVISNIGALALDVASINLTNTTDFERIGWPSIPFTVISGGSQSLVVRFAPKSVGTKSCVMTINSNSKYNAAYDVNLTGTRDSIGFTVSQASIDFGQLCPGELGSKTVTLRNTGTLPITITATDVSGFQVSPNTWTIASGNTQDVTVTFSSSVENNFNATITFEDNFCNFTNSLDVKAEVVKPKITYIPIVITATVGDKKRGTVRITNPSTRNLTITSDNFQCGELTIVTPYPWNITAGGYIDVEVDYSPVSENYLTCYVKLNGTQCNFLDSIKVEGNPNLAIATIQIEKHTGLAGFPVTIPVHLRNMNKITESGAKAINARIAYDQNLLTYQSCSNGTATAGIGYVDVTNMLISSMSGDVLSNLTFMVNISTPNTCLLDLSNSVTTGGYAKLTEADGEFTLNLSEAILYVDPITARTGETVSVPVKISNPKFLSTVHKNIITTLSYNYSLLDPIGSTPTGTLQSDKRVIELTLPVTADPNGVLQTLQFKAMLGTAQNTALDLSNSKVAAGLASFTENDGSFALTNVCISQDQGNPNPRLFDPKGQAQIISISPNPVNGDAVLTIESVEEGIHTVEIYSQLGELVAKLIDKNIDSGVLNLNFSTISLANGSYYIVYKTPTQIFTRAIGIMK